MEFYMACGSAHRVIGEPRLIKNFSLYLALRYLRPKRTFVSVITLISVLGVCFGVAALVIVISVMRGFHQQIQDLALNYDAHIEAYDRWGTAMMPDKQRPKDVKEKGWREVLNDIKATPGVVSASPMVRGMVLVESKEGMAPSWMWGLKQEDGNRMSSKHSKLISAGKLDLNGDNIILDVGLARDWGVEVGDKVTIYSPQNLKEVVHKMKEIDDKPEAEKQEAYKGLKEVLVPLDLTVAGLISPPRLQDSDKMAIVVVPLHVAQEVRGMGDGISSIGIELSDPYQADTLKKQKLVTTVDEQGSIKSEGILPETWSAFTWTEQHAQLFATVQNELEMMYFVLFIIVLVAAFCVMNTMITVTVQKRREIGIIAALGTRVGQIMWVFLIQGMIVGLLGAVTGFGAGMMVVHWRNQIRSGITWMTGREIFDSSIYGLIEIPAKVVGEDVSIICIGAFLLCTLAALVPAFLAARTEPAVALRD
jgi:lipoprotein-releasing system permease protein